LVHRHVLVLGGNRATGLEIVRALKAGGHEPSVLVRPSSDITALKELGVPTIVGSVMASADVVAAAKGKNAIVCAVGGSLLGGGLHFQPTQNMVDAARANAIGRIIMISSIGVGDSHDALPRFVHWVLGRAMKQKARAEEVVKASGLDFTIIRPGNLTHGPATTVARLVVDPKASGRISRTDVGRLTAGIMNDPAAVGVTYAAIAQSF
jgi:nucleoside-diphosphate-sugar epimerase